MDSKFRMVSMVIMIKILDLEILENDFIFISLIALMLFF